MVKVHILSNSRSILRLLNCFTTLLQLSQLDHGERYVKRLDALTHLVVMLYAIIMQFDSLREITASLQTEIRKLLNLGICIMTSKRMLSDANKQRLEAVFEAIY